MDSVWQDTCILEEKKALQGDRKTDVLIIGGGMTGILCGRFLTDQGVDCVVAEAQKVGQGITARTTGKITSQHGLIYDKLLRKKGLEYARLYLEANEKAIRTYANLCENADCHFERISSLVYSLEGKEKLEKELKALDTIGYKARYKEHPNLPFPTDGAVEFPLQAQFHPLEFLKAISQGIHIYENTPVSKITKNGALTPKGRIIAKQIIIASHFPFWNRHGGYFVKMFQERSCVLAGTGGWELDGMYIDGSGEGLSLRNYGPLTLVGSSSQRTGKPVCGWQRLEDFCQDFFPSWKEEYRWANQDCISLDGVPYIGSYYGGQEHVLTATGYNKWGMSGSMVAAMLLADLVLQKENPFASVFSPQRSILSWQLAINGFEAAKNLLTPTAPRCSHLGCALKWNAREVSWDCPCHGSRFNEEGRWIEAPAKKNIKI